MVANWNQRNEPALSATLLDRAHKRIRGKMEKLGAARKTNAKKAQAYIVDTWQRRVPEIARAPLTWPPHKANRDMRMFWIMPGA
jgi:hypothetical protein